MSLHRTSGGLRIVVSKSVDGRCSIFFLLHQISKAQRQSADPISILLFTLWSLMCRWTTRRPRKRFAYPEQKSIFSFFLLFILSFNFGLHSSCDYALDILGCGSEEQLSHSTCLLTCYANSTVTPCLHFVCMNLV